MRLVGEIALRRDRSDVAAARAAFGAAIVLAAERGMRPLLAHCRLGLGRAHQREGESSRARAEMAAALAEYRAMDMTYWMARAEAELATLE